MIGIITLKDIARIAGVDISTVSRALNNSERISKPVREKIHKIAKELNYVPNASAFSLKKKMNRAIAIVTPTIDFPGGDFYQEILRGIDKVICENSFTILLATYKSKKRTFHRIVSERRIDGAIVIGDIFSEKDIKELDELGIPIIMVNQSAVIDAKNIVFVALNNSRLSYRITEHIIKVHNRQKLLYIGGGKEYLSSRERKKGFIRAVKEFRAEYKSIEGDFAYALETGYEIIEDIYDKNRAFDYDAVVCASDNIALGVLNKLKELNIPVPDKVSVFGWDNIRITDFIIPSLSSVDPNAFNMGLFSAETLLNWINSKERPEQAKYNINGELIYRQSCGCGDDR